MRSSRGAPREFRCSLSNWSPPTSRCSALGLSTARELTGGDVTTALVAELQKVAPERQALLLLALADRGDASALPAVLQVAKSGPAAVRIAAIGVVPRLGDVACIPTAAGYRCRR